MKNEQKYLDEFKKLHSRGTYLWIVENMGKKITKEDFIKEHEDTCMAKKKSYKACGAELYEYCIKYAWLK